MNSDGNDDNDSIINTMALLGIERVNLQEIEQQQKQTDKDKSKDRNKNDRVWLDG